MNYHDAKRLARELRKRQTPAEKLFWNNVKNRNFRNLKFTRQFPLSYKLMDNNLNWFIADFHCHELKLIVELDGEIHNSRQEYDKDRDEILEVLGFKIVHFKNEVILSNWNLVKTNLIKIIDNQISIE